MLTQHPSDPSQLLLAVTKSNLGVRPKALSLRIVQAKNGFGAVEWGEESEISADDALNGLSEDDGEREPDGELGAAIAWLHEALKDGPLPSKQVFAEAKDNGFSVGTIKRAKIEAQIPSRKEAGANGVWVWELLVEAELSEEVAHDEGYAKTLAPLAPLASVSTQTNAHADDAIYKESLSEEANARPANTDTVAPLVALEVAQGVQGTQGIQHGGDDAPLVSALPSSPGAEVLTDPWDGDDPDWPAELAQLRLRHLPGR